mgnify:CR=1 FL=1
MNKLILNTDIQFFINSNANSIISDLLLKGTSFPNVDTKTIIEQIEAKKRCKTKLSTWYNTPNIYYPNKLNIEQTSSETTAKFKSKLLNGHSIIDLTGGYGVDCFYFSKQFKIVTHCEINETLSEIVKHNFKQLNVANIETVKADGIEFLKGNVTLNHDLGQMKAGVATLNKGGPSTEFSSILLQQDVSIFLESQGNLFSDQAFFDFQTMTGEALCEDYPVIFKGNELDLFCKTIALSLNKNEKNFLS